MFLYQTLAIVLLCAGSVNAFGRQAQTKAKSKLHLLSSVRHIKQPFFSSTRTPLFLSAPEIPPPPPAAPYTNASPASISKSSLVSPKQSALIKNVLLAGWVGVFGYTIAPSLPITRAWASQQSGGLPVLGSDSIMKTKAHGTSDKAVQPALKWNCDVSLADRICNYNRHYAEHAGYWTQETTFLKEVEPRFAKSATVLTFYDSVTGVPLFVVDTSLRSFSSWKEESLSHGWPSFRDNEVVWDNVRSLGDGEMVSLTGTHLGHNLPDRNGNRYCINLVSIAGYPVASTQAV